MHAIRSGHVRGTACISRFEVAAFPQVRGVSAGLVAALIMLSSIVRFHLATETPQV